MDDHQKNAWVEQIDILKRNLLEFLQGYILLEYSIPRMGKRIDVVLLISGIVILLEFKVGDSHYSTHAIDQVLDYAVDLKYFHKESHSLPIVPIVVSTEAREENASLESYEDQIYRPLKVYKNNLGQIIHRVLNEIATSACDPVEWRDSI